MKNLWHWLQRKFLYVQSPKIIPPDTIIVLTIYKNHITGWQTPESARNRDIWYKRGVRFVCLSQGCIDQFIPLPSRDRIEEAMEQYEFDEARY